MAIGSNNNVSNNQAHALSFDTNGGVSAIKTGGVIDLAGTSLRGANVSNNDRISQVANAALGNRATTVYEIA